MSRILLIYASHEGQAAAIARRMGRAFAALDHVATVLPLGDAAIEGALADCDTVVIGAGVRYGSHGRGLERLVRRHLGAISSRRNAFFSVSMSAARPGDGQREAARYIEAFSNRTGWLPQRTAAFAGALPYTRYNLFLRFVMRRISRSVGGDMDTSRDYEYTDWAAVDRFASELVEARGRLAA